jgi:N-acyl-D-aspartate/D-glutamate deacylase
LLAATNYENKNLDDVRTMLVHPNTVPALGDGGAHYGTICDSTYTTFMLTHWGRDRQHGRLPMPEIIAAMTSRPAAMMGMTDRGRIAVGLKADINVIDFDNLALHAPRMVSDLPSGGRRLTQGASGYIATIVSGTVIQRNGRATGALPGRMVARSALEYAPLAAE